MKTNSDNHGPIIGIDFGTTKTMVAEFDPVRTFAKVRKLGLSGDEMPTSMYVTDTDEVLFGDDADDEGIHDSTNHIRRFKMLLGKSTETQFGSNSAKPTDLVAKFLSHLRGRLESEVFHRPVEHVVLTVPAMFGPAQRKDLTLAAERAGFKKVELLAEPVAAGIAYCDHHTDLSKNLRFLVVDWGGGTFDFAVVERNGADECKVLLEYVGGASGIGGEDLDDELWLAVSEMLKNTGSQPLELQPKHERGKYWRELTRAKEGLSTKINLTMNFTIDGGKLERIPIDRSKLEEVFHEKVHQGARQVAELVERCRRNGRTPEFILLAGGTSRIPMIPKLLEQVAGLPCRTWSEGRDAIALGAAIHAYRILDKPEILAESATTQCSRPGENFSAMSQYKSLLEGAWIDGVISNEEGVFLVQKRKELGLTIEDSERIQREVLGALIRDIAENEPASSTDYSARKFNCPNPQCGKEMVLTPGEFASKTYKCPYCKQSGSFFRKNNTNTAQKQDAVDATSKLQKPIVLGNITPPIEVREIQKIIKTEINSLPQSNFHDFSIYIENIPPEKLRNAILSYAYVKSNEVILFHDATVFGSAKEGIVLTSTHVFWKDLSDIPRKLGYDEITSLVEKPALTFLGAGLMVNGMPMTPQGGFHAKALAKCVYRMLLRISNLHKRSN
jgi:actin-like ATPase involved in cell morphogenesis